MWRYSWRQPHARFLETTDALMSQQAGHFEVQQLLDPSRLTRARVLAVLPRSLGDVLMTTPTLQGLRDALPDAQIEVVVPPAVASVLKETGAVPVKHVWPITPRRGWQRVLDLTRMVVSLAKRRPDLLINIAPQGLSNGSLAPALALLLRVPFAVASAPLRFRSPLKRWVWRRAFDFMPSLPIPNHQHVVVENMGLLAAFGKPCPGEISMRAGFSVKDKVWAAHRVTSFWPDRSVPPQSCRDYIVIAPGASHPARSLDSQSCSTLMRGLIAGGHHVVLTTGDTWHEKELAASVREQLASHAFLDLAGALSVGQLVALVAGARCVVSVDAGTMHVAAATFVPVVALFGPTDAWRVAPWRTPSICLSHASRCPSRIPTTEILAAVNSLIVRRAPHS